MSFDVFIPRIRNIVEYAAEQGRKVSFAMEEIDGVGHHVNFDYNGKTGEFTVTGDINCNPRIAVDEDLNFLVDGKVATGVFEYDNLIAAYILE